MPSLLLLTPCCLSALRPPASLSLCLRDCFQHRRVPRAPARSFHRQGRRGGGSIQLYALSASGGTKERACRIGRGRAGEEKKRAGRARGFFNFLLTARARPAVSVAVSVAQGSWEKTQPGRAGCECMCVRRRRPLKAKRGVGARGPAKPEARALAKLSECRPRVCLFSPRATLAPNALTPNFALMHDSMEGLCSLSFFRSVPEEEGYRVPWHETAVCLHACPRPRARAGRVNLEEGKRAGCRGDGRV